MSLPEATNENKPKLFLAENREGKDFEIDVKLNTEYISRMDYGDLGRADKFQACLVSEFDSFFGITLNDICDQRIELFRQKGLDLSPRLTREIIVNARFKNIDQLSLESLSEGKDASIELSRNDVEKTFSLLCAQLLRE